MWVVTTEASYCAGCVQTGLRLTEITLARQPNSGNMDRPLELNHAPSRRTDAGTSNLARGDHGVVSRIRSGIGPDPALRQPGRPKIARPLHIAGIDNHRPSWPCL